MHPTSSRRLAVPACLLCLAAMASSAHAFHGKVWATGLTLPLFVTAPRGDARVFVVEQTGAIKAFKGGKMAVFLDISDMINTDGPAGLLGLAFDPAYKDNGRFYVDYVERDTLDTVVARYTVTPPSSNHVDPATHQEILRYPQPSNPSHRGGWLAFRPGDPRDLYISTGDGSHAYDEFNNAQNGKVLLGKILRIDVSGAGAGYRIPADNPFIDAPHRRPELWALGLRNPFRPSFDRASGDFWIVDVGQDTREEIDFEAAGDPGGHNYGWRLREGTKKTPNGVGGSDKGMTDPVFDYPHEPHRRSLGDSITGGFVYRGPPIADADGRYFFGDYVSNHVYSFNYDANGIPGPVRDDTAAMLGTSGLQGVSSFGEDARGRLFTVGNNGVILVMCPDEAVTETIEGLSPCLATVDEGRIPEPERAPGP
jgi:glucose/arabinose dehydrogenase